MAAPFRKYKSIRLIHGISLADSGTVSTHLASTPEVPLTMTYEAGPCLQVYGLGETHDVPWNNVKIAVRERGSK